MNETTSFKREPVFTAPDGIVYHSGINREGIKNGIKITGNEQMIIKRAYLTDGQGNELKENVVGLNETIKLNIETYNKWTEVNGRSFIGGSVVATTEKGTPLEGGTEDAYASYEAEGFNPADAQFLNLWFAVKEVQEPTAYYTIKFRLWDKKGSGEITGSYKFRVR